jgi:hypothetical protein
MSTIADIDRGEEILVQRPLARHKTGLSDTHDANRFFSPGSIYSGARYLEKIRDSLPTETVNRLSALYNKDHKNALLGLSLPTLSEWMRMKKDRLGLCYTCTKISAESIILTFPTLQWNMILLEAWVFYVLSSGPRPEKRF